MRVLLMLLAVVAMAAIPAAAQQTAAEKPAKAGAATAARPAAAATSLVNLNSATQAQLELLPGLGSKVAERILEYRQKNGPFKKVEDLMNVKGIGEKSFLKLKPLLTVSDKEKAAPSGV